MQFTNLDSYESSIREISQRMVGSRQVDHMGLDRGDYRSKLRFLSWETQIKFRERHKFCEPQERLYVNRTLWNAARDFARKRKYRVQQTRQLKVEVESTYCEQARYEAREMLRVLETQLGSEFQLLRRVGEMDGRISDAHDPDEDGTFDKFRWRIRRLRIQAKKILEDHAKT